MNRFSLIQPVSTQIQLRQATPEDYPFVKQLSQNNFLHYINEAGGAWDEAVFQSFWDITFNVIVMLHDQPIGSVRLHLGEEKAILWDFQLKKRFCRQGIGSYLMKIILKTCTEEGCSSICLEVFKSNPAQHLYKHYGFEVIQENEHSLYMSRPLT